MKTTIILITGLILFCGSCKKESNTPTDVLIETVDTNAVLQSQAVFMNGPYGAVTGKAKLFQQNEQFTLLLDRVEITNGPDLHVYLSEELVPVHFIDLGQLRSVSGSHVYTITGMPDFARYKYALVHCQLFNHLFGSAQLQP